MFAHRVHDMRAWMKATSAGVVVSALCVWALFAFDRNEKGERAAELERETHLVSAQCSSRLRAGIEMHRIAIGQMASFYDNSEEVTEEEFRSFAARTMARTPLCLRISYVDASLHIRWVNPAVYSRGMVGFDVHDHPQGLTVIRRAEESRRVALSEPLKLIGESRGFLLAAPTYKKGVFAGAVVCAIRSQDFFDSMVLPEVMERYEEEVWDGRVALFMSSEGHKSAMTLPQAEDDFSVAGRTWRVRVTPRMEVARARLETGGAAFWTLGWLVVLAAGAATGGAVQRSSGIAHRLDEQGAALRKTRAQLDGAREQLLQAEKLTALGELVAGVAHELNNPLASVLGYSQLALREGLPPRVQRRLETVVSETERAAKIVKNLLTFARKHPPEKRYLGLNGIIEKTAELRSYQLSVNQVRIEKDLQPDLPKTMLDFPQIQQVFINLINNAEQAITERGTGGTIRLSTRHAGGRIVARVTDDGPGVPSEIRSRIFEPFFTTKKEGKGTGLGLSLCYGIIKEHGGTIQAEDAPGGGACFEIELPVVSGEEAVEPVAEAAAVPGSALEILVIDDEPSLLSFLVEVLTALGHKVDTAADVPEALRKTAEAEHDLVICDIKMPHGNGREVYEAVRARSPEAARRIVFSSGDGTNPDLAEFLQKTRSKMLLKPYRIEEIEKIIASVRPR